MMVLMVGGVSDSREVQEFSSYLSDESSDESLQANRNKTAYQETYDCMKGGGGVEVEDDSGNI